MVLRAIEGWDGFATGLSGSTWTNILGDKWLNSNVGTSGTVTEIDDRYTDEKTWRNTNNTGYLSMMLDDNPDEIAAGLYFRNQKRAYERQSADWKVICSLNNGSSEFVQLEANGRDIRVKIRNGTIDAILSNVLESYQRWTLIELKAKRHATTGYWYVYINGVEVGSHTGIDTTISTLVVDRMYFRNSDYYVTGDIYVCDLTGSQNNDILGAFHVQGILPDANGDDSDWTPSANGDNYTMVNEETANESIYVESDTTDEQDLYNYEDLAGTWDEIFGLQINTRLVLDANGSETAAILCSSNGTEDSANFTVDELAPIGYGDEQQFQRIIEVDPDTSNAWDANGIDAAQFGIKFI